jgi:hypothetical protein
VSGAVARSDRAIAGSVARPYRASAVPFLAAASLLLAAGFVHASAGDLLARAPGAELLYFPSGRSIRPAALGYETAAADVAWIRGIQYYGAHRLTDQNYEQIGHVMSVVTDLDPRFEAAYVFGAFVLAQELRRPDDGLELLAKGIRANPSSWTLAFETGFLHYVCRRDYDAASRWFVRASRLPDHPDYVERFAAFASHRAGDDATAALLWKRVLTTGNKYMQEVARRELARLGSEGGSS